LSWPAGRGGCALEGRPELSTRDEPVQALDLSAVVEDHDRRDALHPEPCCHRHVAIDVDPVDRDPAAILGGYSFEARLQRATGRTRRLRTAGRRQRSDA